MTSADTRENPLHTIAAAVQTAAGDKTVPAVVLYLIAIIVAVLDQMVKAWASKNLLPLGREGMAVIPGIFHFTYTENRGMAFSLLEGQQPFLIGAAILVMVGIVLAQRQLGPRIPVLLAVSLGLALGGALGNGIDRARIGYVVDLFDARFLHFPIFNVADTAITFGIVLLAFRVALHPAPKETDSEAAASNTHSKEVA